MRKLINALALVVALAIPTWAGNIGCPVAPPPDDRQSTSSTESAKAGDIAGSELAISLLQSLLALF